MKYFPLILLGVLLNAAAQILLKRGMMDLGQFSFTLREAISIIPKVGTNFLVLGGFLCYAVSVIVWMGVLSRVEVSFAYPMLSIGYLVVLTYGYFWGGEQVGLERILGVLLICTGVVFLFRSA